MTELTVDNHLLDYIENRLELRPPNRRAVESVAVMTSEHFDVEGSTDPYECIVDSATGVGKTYVMAGLIEYFAGTDRPVRNFLLLAPGRTIRDKSILNFSPGNRRSLTSAMASRPYLVTADNFDSPATATAMNDDSQTKLYIFTAQALASKDGEGRATHEFMEGLGGSFYKWLSEREDLVILADEQHCYRGPGFSRTIRELNPQVVVGLTATPHKNDDDLVVYRYPLATAIEDRHVKTPVLVARKDDRSDDRTKLLDGVTLLRYKETVAHAYCADNDLPNVNPVMLVIAKDIAEAEEFQHILDSSDFDNGAWIGKNLLVHSKLTGDKKEEALDALDAVEDPASPVRIIISVGMLKEGWDVKNVYVIASMRSSVSEVLTEQTLGRGMRLPFGGYTDIEMLDTLEVLAHEKYEALLAKREVLNEKFIDHAILIEIRSNAEGKEVARRKFIETETPVIGQSAELVSSRADDATSAEGASDTASGTGVVDLEDLFRQRERQIVEVGDGSKVDHMPLPARESISVPYIEHVPQTAEVSLNQIHDEEPFAKLGRALATEVDTELTRTLLQAKDGHIQGVAAEKGVSAQTLDIPLETSRRLLLETVMRVKGVQPRQSEIGRAQQLVDVVITSMGEKAGLHLSAYFERCARRIAALIATELKAVTTDHVTFSGEVRFKVLDKARTTNKRHVREHTENFNKASAYNGWLRNLYEYAWFDSSTEYKAATAIDDSASVIVWARLHINDLPITWTQESRNYNPDFVVIEEVGGDRTCWLVETKMDKEMDSAEVVGKRKAAKTWANTVNSSPDVTGTWKYLLLSEQDVADAGGNWEQMKGFGS